MSKDVDSMVLGMGIAAGIVLSLVELTRERGGSSQALHRLVKPEGRATLIEMVDLAIKASGTKPNTYQVTVDYSMTLEQMIAAGRYDWKNDDINAANFPIKGNGKTDSVIRLVHFDREVTTREVETEIDKLGLRSLELPGLLALGAKFPYLQRQFPIIGLGSSWVDSGGDCGVPYLDGDVGDRTLGLWGNPSGGWRGVCRFAAVSK